MVTRERRTWGDGDEQIERNDVQRVDGGWRGGDRDCASAPWEPKPGTGFDVADNGVQVSVGTASPYDHSASAYSVPLSSALQRTVLPGSAHIVNAQVVAVSESPKTESLWFDGTAHDSEGQLVTTQRMMLRS
jgi:hypothetical protein